MLPGQQLELVPGSHPAATLVPLAKCHGGSSHSPRDAAHPAQARLHHFSSSSSSWTIVPEPVSTGDFPAGEGEWLCPPSSATRIHSILL